MIKKNIFLICVGGLILLEIVVFFFALPSSNTVQQYSGPQTTLPTPMKVSGNFISAPMVAKSPLQTHPSLPTKGEGDTVAIPYGARLPAALMDEGAADDNQGIRDMLGSIRDDFFANYQASLAAGHSDGEAWDTALHASDERYRAIFGQEAYDEAVSASADDAATDYNSPSR